MPDPLEDLLAGDEVDNDNRDTQAATNRANAERRKEQKALDAELSELRAFKLEREQIDRQNAIGKVFTEVGLNPKHGKLYAALHPEGETTTEQVAQFATEYGLVTTEGEAVEVPEVKTGFTPTVINEGTALGSKVYTHDEFIELMRTDQNKAFQLYQAGRVKLDKLPESGGLG